MDSDTKTILGIVSDVQENMATVKDVSAIRDKMATRDQVKDIHSELHEIKFDIAQLKEGFGDMRGYAKEIDALMERVATIEKQLDSKQRAAA